MSGASPHIAAIGSVYAERFEILGYMDSGIMGSVYRARQTDKDRVVALKVIRSDLIEDPEIVERFHREMRITAAIKHPNTVRVLQYGHTSDGSLYLAMELLQGRSLDEVIAAEAPMPADRVARIAAQIAAGLGAAHEAKVIHRDLKPENIMVVEGPDGALNVKVLDFGLAHVAEGDEGGDAKVTQIGSRVGTPTYMAPEYIETFQCDPRADLYALGVLMFEMLTGKAPYGGGPYEVFVKHVQAPIPAIEPAPPPWLAELVRALLSKQPDQRPENAAAVIQALAKALPELAKTSDRPAPRVAAAPTPETGTTPSWGVYAGFALVLTGLAVAAGTWWAGR